MRKFIFIIICIGCMACLLTACKVEKDDDKDIGEIDPSVSHISLSLGEDVTIDADIMLAYNGWVNNGSNGKEVEHIVSSCFGQKDFLLVH